MITLISWLPHTNRFAANLAMNTTVTYPWIFDEITLSKSFEKKWGKYTRETKNTEHTEITYRVRANALSEE